MNGILVGCTVEKIYTMKDRSVKIILETSEISSGKAGELFALMNQAATVYIKSAEISQKELNQVDAIEIDLGGKTPSKRMRNVLFRCYENDNEGYGEFDTYYKTKMEKFIKELKNNLP